MPLARIGFILASNRRTPLPSTRISVLNMLPFLSDAGFATQIVHEPAEATSTPDLDGLDVAALARAHDIVFLQKCHGPSALRLVRRLEAAGVRTVFGVCDLVEPSMVEATSATAVVTPYLRSLYPASLQVRMHVVHDGIEAPERYRIERSTRRGTRADPLRAVLVTSAAPARLEPIGPLPDWLRVTVVGAYPARLPHPRAWRWLWEQFVGQPPARRRQLAAEVTAQRLHFVPWHPAGVYAQLELADVAIIPVDPQASAAWAVKSENRLTLKMATGLPVVCTPIPAYEPIVVHGENAWFARSRGDWLDGLEWLREPAQRVAMGERARAAVMPRYSKQSQADALIGVLRGVLAREDSGHAR